MVEKTRPTPQRHVVISGDLDKKRQIIEKSNRDSDKNEQNWKEIYPPAMEKYDLNVDEGDILFVTKRSARNTLKKRRMETALNTLQQVSASSSLAGLQVKRAVFDTIYGSNEEERMARAAEEEITVVGVALTHYTHDGTDFAQKEGLAILTGGMHYTLNNGPETVNITDVVAWRCPRPSEEQLWDIANMGHSRSRKRLKTVPLKSLSAFTSDSLYKWFIAKASGTGVEKLDIADLNVIIAANPIPAAAVTMFNKLFDEFSASEDDLSSEFQLWKDMHACAKALFFTDEDVKTWLIKKICELRKLTVKWDNGSMMDRKREQDAYDMVLGTFKHQWLKQSSHVLGRACSSGTPGETFDIYLG